VTAGEKLQKYAECLREAAAQAEMSFGDGLIKMTPELARATADDIDQLLRDLDAEALSVAAATSPPEGETRREAAGWISVDDRLPEGRGEIYAEGLEDSAKVLAACITQDGRRKCGLATYVRDHELPEDSGWCGIINETEEIDDRHAKVTHWMPLPELPEEGEAGCG